MLLINKYESTIEPIRSKNLESDFIKQATASHIAPDLLHLFWIYYSVLGVQMTKPVEQWIFKAGSACIDKGFDELGQQLTKHSKHEAGHHKMMERDSQGLINLWNKEKSIKVQLQDFIEPTPRVVQAYIDLHENNITGDSPWGQIAIEYEIERISVVLGPPIIVSTLNSCGEHLLEELTFLKDHVAIDAAHTEYNHAVLSEFLQKYPESLPKLLSIGTEALETYTGFLRHCFEKAADHQHRMEINKDGLPPLQETDL